MLHMGWQRRPRNIRLMDVCGSSFPEPVLELVPFVYNLAASSKAIKRVGNPSSDAGISLNSSRRGFSTICMNSCD